MSATLKKAIGFTATVAILLVAYAGNYLPLRKSQAFIEASQKSASAQSLDGFVAIMSVPLDRYSPIGQEELVRNTANNLLNVVRAVPNPQLSVAILEYINRYYEPIIAREGGMSYMQDLYIMGIFHQTVYQKTGDPKYLETSRMYFQKAHDLGPTRPQPLYGLFDSYRMEKNNVETVRLGEQILGLWPADESVRAVVEEAREAMSEE